MRFQQVTETLNQELQLKMEALEIYKSDNLKKMQVCKHSEYST